MHTDESANSEERLISLWLVENVACFQSLQMHIACEQNKLRIKFYLCYLKISSHVMYLHLDIASVDRHSHYPYFNIFGLNELLIFKRNSVNKKGRFPKILNFHYY
jgi:hypothetical protein